MTTITIGLDGANWPLLEPLLEDGTLPNLAALVEEGIGGTSESCLPPLTVPNWKCFSTGKNPGKLGVFRFDRIDTDARTHKFHDATDFQSAELWDYLNDAGYTTGVINKPSTYPPKDIDGFIVAGGPDASDSEYRSLDQGFATPNSVERFLTKELDYEVHPSPMISPTETGEAEVTAILDLIDDRFEAADRLLDRENPDYLHLTIFYNMALQHYFFRDEPVVRAWKRIDENLARFTDQGHDIVLFSDHGTCRVDTVFYINVWLAEQGYLETSGSVDSILRSLGVTRERALFLAKRLGMVEFLSRVIPERVQKAIPWEEGVKRDRVLATIDWDETRAVASNQGPIYLNVDDPDEYERLREELIKRLESLTHPETGARIVNAVHRGEEYYSGTYADQAPALILDQGPNVHTSDAVGPSSWYSESGVWRGGNMPEGLFLMQGPSFRSDGLGHEARIFDLAPTVLHLLDVSVPSDVDGEVLDVFAQESEPSSRNITFQDPLPAERMDSATNGDDVEQRLVELGYLE